MRRGDLRTAIERILDDTVIELVGGEHAEANLARLIAMMRDKDPANRDWATLLLAQQDFDTPRVRDALLGAAEDENEYVRAEAILGLAQRDKALALPLLQRELRGTFFYVTNDQVEAMSLADRIAVLNKGVLQQLDTPEKIYQQLSRRDYA